MDNFPSGFFAQEWALFLTVAAILLIVSEAGLRCGLRLHAAKDEAHKVQIGGIQGAVLGLLGLLLGFAMAMAAARYDLRRDMVVKQANAIGTAYLRSSLLPESHFGPVRDLLGRYVDLWIKYQPLGDSSTELAEGRRLGAAIEAELWEHATAAAREAPTCITGQFIAALNETIDTGSGRVAAARAHLPGGVWLLLLIVATVGSFTTSYNAGAKGARTVLAGLLLPLLVTVIIILIFDLANPWHGWVRTSQRPLIELQQSLQSKQR